VGLSGWPFGLANDASRQPSFTPTGDNGKVGAMSVDVQRVDRILVITMQRPEKRNAINRELAFGISAALDTLDGDDELWVGVLTGTPDVFSAGTDLRVGADARTERGGEYRLIRRRRRKPLIATVEGPWNHGVLRALSRLCAFTRGQRG
jgi:enoyl-CoA hydratase/carnithine racemase